MRVAQLRVLGGAMARVPVDATAYAHRNSKILVNLAAFYEDEAERVDAQAWMEEFASAIRQSDQRRLRQLRRRRGRGTRPRRVSRRDLGPPRRDQAPLRPGQPVPAEPEHPAGVRLTAVSERRTGPPEDFGAWRPRPDVDEHQQQAARPEVRQFASAHPGGRGARHGVQAPVSSRRSSDPVVRPADER